MRFKVLDDNKLKGLIDLKEELADKVQDITKQIEKLEEDRNKIVLKLQRYNDKATPLIAKYQDEKELGEFEKYSRVYKDPESGELRLEIYDEVEEFKNYLKNREEEEAKKKEDAEQSSETKGDNK